MNATTQTETVHDRIATVRETATPGQVAATLALATAIAFALVLAHEPLVHDSMHTFRHATGIACHG